MCVDGELGENHSQKLVCKMRERNSQTNSQPHSGVSKTEQTLCETKTLIPETAR